MDTDPYPRTLMGTGGLSFVSRVWIRELYIRVLPARLPSLVRARACACARMHADAEAQMAPPPSRTAARGSRRPGGRSS
jgi:hypothetical protein